MAYQVKEIFYTLQGEGSHAGRPAVFCRFAGCNLWSGREQDRATAVCKFCDTDFVGTDGTLGGKFSTAQALAERIAAQWPAGDTVHRFVVMTGGEPLLQVDTALIDALHAMNDTDPDYNYVALQTNYNETHVVGVLGDGMVFYPLVHYGCVVSSTECIHYLLHAQHCPDTFLCLDSSSTSAGCAQIGPRGCDVG